ncbi:DUF934 domain-containing protein [Acidocella facilis]|uniref:DUF934 domain-containing protein n=1 Tax=Acidocella facilis TaxID=525 RepID=UPI00068C10C2|nr:DUF934 domain-containing protein [Acidocella facilis]
MPLIDRKAAEIADPQGLTLYPAADLPASLSGPSGVILSPDADLALLAPHLPALAVVTITFPKFRDGRGFTIARSLRQHYGYAGDIRATGHFLPEQFGFLIACGFTSFETPATHGPAQFAAALAAPHQPGQLLRRTLGRALEPV